MPMEVIFFTSMAPPPGFFSTPGGAATISAGASILDSAFGGGGMSKGRMRSAYNMAEKYRGRQIYNDMQTTVHAAKSAGLHPLFALGASPQGNSPAFQMPGQSQRGSRLSDAVQGALAAYQGTQLHTAQKDLVEAQAELSRARALEQVTSNDNASTIVGNAPSPQVVGPHFNPDTQELKKGEVKAMYNPKHPEQAPDVLRPMVRVALGSQSPWIPVEEVDTFMEDPAAVSAATMLYHGNANIDWPLLINEYRYGTAATPAQTTTGTKRMFRRIKQARIRNLKPKASNQFYGYSRGPHR